MMRKRLPMPQLRKRLSLGPLLLALCCIGALWLQGQAYYGEDTALYHRMAGLQVSMLYGLPYEGESEPAPSPNVGTDIAEGVSEGIRIELLSISEAPTVDLTGSEPRILIYHTHTTEAYFKTPAHDYTETSAWRTDENAHNIVAVGEKLADLLQNTYGISVIHDTPNHEPPKLATSYSRSEVTMKKYKEAYPSITMFIDVHRDAYGNDPQEPADYIMIDGKEVARMMFVVGTGEGATGTGYEEMPDFAANYALAKRITESLAEIDPNLMRNIRVKTGRYNQHISNQCLLVEVGHNANTLEQALNAVDYLAAAIAQAAGIEADSVPTSLFAPQSTE